MDSGSANFAEHISHSFPFVFFVFSLPRVRLLADITSLLLGCVHEIFSCNSIPIRKRKQIINKMEA